MSVRILSIVGWICFALDLAFVVALFVTKNAGDDAAGRGVSRGYALVLLPILAGAGALLWWATKSQSKIGIIAATLLVGLPFLMLAGNKVSQMMASMKHNRFESMAGHFQDKALAQAAKFVNAGDTASLRAFLAEQHASGKTLAYTQRDERGYTLLGLAVFRASSYEWTPENIAVLRLLFDAGVPYAADAIAAGGDWVRDIVVQYGDQWNEVIAIGLEHGANANATEQYDHHNMVLSPEQTIAKLELLTKHGADLNAISAEGESTIMRAVRFKKWANAKFFLDHGVSTQYVAPDGSTLQSVLDGVIEKQKMYQEGLGDGYEAFAEALKARNAKVAPKP